MNEVPRVSIVIPNEIDGVHNHNRTSEFSDVYTTSRPIVGPTLSFCQFALKQVSRVNDAYSRTQVPNKGLKHSKDFKLHLKNNTP